MSDKDPRLYCRRTVALGLDIFKQERVSHSMPATIPFGGQEGHNDRGGHNVPKLSLASRLQAPVHAGRLHMLGTLPLAKTFRRELLDFRASHAAIGNATVRRARARTTT